jgi:hypothetical protein
MPRLRRAKGVGDQERTFYCSARSIIPHGGIRSIVPLVRNSFNRPALRDLFNHCASRDSFKTFKSLETSTPCTLRLAPSAISQRTTDQGQLTMNSMPYASPASNLRPLASGEAKPPGSLHLTPCARETTDNGPLALSLSKDGQPTRLVAASRRRGFAVSPCPRVAASVYPPPDAVGGICASLGLRMGLAGRKNFIDDVLLCLYY